MIMTEGTAWKRRNNRSNMYTLKVNGGELEADYVYFGEFDGLDRYVCLFSYRSDEGTGGEPLRREIAIFGSSEEEVGIGGDTTVEKLLEYSGRIRNAPGLPDKAVEIFGGLIDLLQKGNYIVIRSVH